MKYYEHRFNLLNVPINDEVKYPFWLWFSHIFITKKNMLKRMQKEYPYDGITTVQFFYWNPRRNIFYVRVESTLSYEKTYPYPLLNYSLQKINNTV